MKLNLNFTILIPLSLINNYNHLDVKWWERGFLRNRREKQLIVFEYNFILLSYCHKYLKVIFVDLSCVKNLILWSYFRFQ